MHKNVPVSSTTPLAAQVSTAQTNMAQTFKVFDPATGEYVEKEIPGMTQPAEAVQQVAEAAAQAVPTIQVQPQLQQMPVLVQDPATGQMVQQMMTVQYDPATGTYTPVQQQPVDPKVLAEQQKAAEKAKKEAERVAREQEAAERRARADELREEAAERARRNDSVAGRVKNTAISTATRQVVSSLTKNVTKVIDDLIGGGKKK